MRLHAIDVAADDLIVLAEADLVILAAPVRQNIALLDELDENVRSRRSSPTPAAPSATIVDGGARAAAALHVRRRPPARRRGARRPRARAAGSVQRPPVAVHADRRRRRRGAREAVGVRRGRSAPSRASIGVDAHDRLLAFLSHLPQLTASALMQVVGDAVGRGRAGARRARARRHDAARVEPGRHLAGHRRDQRRRDRPGARRADRAAAGSAAAISPDGDRLAEVFTDAARWRGSLKR